MVKIGIKGRKIIIILTAIAAMVAIGLAALFGAYGIIYSEARKKYMPEPLENAANTAVDKIHFLDTGSSDAILLESDGKFALVDAGEDTDNPRGFADLNLPGYEDKVVEYLKRVATGADGKVTLEFVVGTHAHSDHLGGFDTVISDPDIVVKEAYLKEYDATRISTDEVEDWDNTEVYEHMLAACDARGVRVISDLASREIRLGNFNITIYNGAVADYGERVGENDNSLALLITDGRYKALLMGDVNFNHGVEKAIGRAVGKVDLIKVGHHGNLWSTGTPFLSATKPDIAIFTNVEGGAKFPVEFRLAMTCGTAMYATGEYGGIVAAMEADGIKLYSGIH